MSLSYEEAIAAIVKGHSVSEETAALMVADIYPGLADESQTIQDDIAFDPIGDAPLLYRAPLPEGQPVPVDDERSPAGALAAQAARNEAAAEGDRYRRLSRRTSLHEAH